MLGLSLWAASLVYLRGIKFSRDHLFVAKNRKAKAKQNTRKQLSFWLTKNWCSGLKINVAETGPVHGMGVGAGFRLQSPPLKSRDHSLCACSCDAWGNTNTGSLSFRFFLTLFLLLDFSLFVLFFHGDSLSLSCKKYHRVAYMAMILNRPHPATQPVLSKPTFLFSVWQEKQEREREREKRLKEWISRPKHKKPVALGHPPNRWDVFLATSGDTIPCTTFALFGRDTTAFKRLNAQVVSLTLVLEEPIHYASQIYSHQFSKETFHADGSNSNQFSAISSVTSPFSP